MSIKKWIGIIIFMLSLAYLSAGLLLYEYSSNVALKTLLVSSNGQAWEVVVPANKLALWRYSTPLIVDICDHVDVALYPIVGLMSHLKKQVASSAWNDVRIFLKSHPLESDDIQIMSVSHAPGLYYYRKYSVVNRNCCNWKRIYINGAQQVDSAEASTIAVPPSEPSGSPR